MTVELLFSYLAEPTSYAQTDFLTEANDAELAGFVCHSFPFEPLVDGDVETALADLPDGRGQTLIYRGFMPRTSEYALLEDALRDKGYAPLTSAHEFAQAHYLPNYYDHIKDCAIPAVWTWSTDPDEAWELAQEKLGPPPYLIKDHVKSAKAAWQEACFIPADATRQDFARICNALVEYRGDRFEEGIVVRSFVDLRKTGDHPSGFPTSEEYRLFFFDGRPLMFSSYYADGTPLPDDIYDFVGLDDVIDSPFFVVDLARKTNGELVVIEVGDGGVSLVPESVDVYDFYQELMERVS